MGSVDTPGREPDPLGNGPITEREPDPLVRQLQSEDSQPPGPTFEGFFDHTGRDGYERLYLTGDGQSYIEFKADDVVTYAAIPADRSLVLGEPATAIRLTRDAQVVYVRNEKIDDFDLRLAASNLDASDLERLTRFGSHPTNGHSYYPHRC